MMCADAAMPGTDDLKCAPLLTGCGTQHPHSALGGTCVLLAAAPTTPPCFRHWRRSSSLLRINSGIMIFISRLSRSAERSKRIFTRGVVTANDSCHACFCWKRRCGGQHPQQVFLIFSPSSSGHGSPAGCAAARCSLQPGSVHWGCALPALPTGSRRRCAVPAR